MRNTSIIAVLALAGLQLSASSCRPRAHVAAPGASAPEVTATCASGATLTDGPYRYENNQWGADKERGQYEQCLLERTARDRKQRGWTWNWPGSDSSVFAYPEIIFGWKPWTGGTSSDPRFPLKLAQMGEIAIRYDVETEASGSYNLAPEVWLISRRSSAGRADPSLITSEIMFWVEAAGIAQPAGTVVERPVVNGVTYELWQKDNAGASPSRGGWRLLSFKIPKTERAGTVPVSELLRYLAGKGLVSPEQYVACVEFGNEISGGRGTTWVKEFTVDVKP